MPASSSPEKTFGKDWVRSIISPVSAADNAKIDDFTFYLTLSWLVTFLRKFQNSLKSSRLELSIAASPTTLSLLVRELASRGGGDNIPSPPPPALCGLSIISK